MLCQTLAYVLGHRINKIIKEKMKCSKNFPRRNIGSESVKVRKLLELQSLTAQYW